MADTRKRTEAMSNNTPNDLRKPRVSVCMITYNHEPFIAQAIEGVVMQQTPWPFELVIGEDCSTDGTRAIAEAYANQYPGVIRLLPSTTNLGAQANGHRTLQACQGEYLAFCEGDDYWTDCSKLAKQVAFLDDHPDYALCYHNYRVLRRNDDGEMEEHVFFVDETEALSPGVHAQKPPQTHTGNRLLWGTPIMMMTMVMRNLFGQGLPAYMEKVVVGDWVMSVLAARTGTLRYMDEVMGTYRWHAGGIWTGRSARGRAEAHLFASKVMLKNIAFSFKDRVILSMTLMNRYEDIIRAPGLRAPSESSLRWLYKEVAGSGVVGGAFLVALVLWLAKKVLPHKLIAAGLRCGRREVG